MNNFDDYYWHDAELKEIKIVRDEIEAIRLIISWPYEIEKNYCVEFLEIYGLKADMHFNYFPPETILSALCIDSSSELDAIRNAWKPLGLDLSKLVCYEIITNTSNSMIKIFALNFKIFPL